MGTRGAAWLAWSVCALSLILTSLGLLFLALNRSHPGAPAFEFAFRSVVIVASCSSVGVLLASRRPAHPIGWLFGALGLLSGVHLLCGEYAVYALVVEGGSMPGGWLSAWITCWLWVPKNALPEVAGSICTGALVVASVGLLEGRRATTHWVYYKILEQFGATYVGRRWLEDGKFISSAGVTAGIDMALHLAARLTDEETAKHVQRSLGYDPHPPYGGMDYDHLGAMSAVRAALSLAAPVIAAKPKRITKQHR